MTNWVERIFFAVPILIGVLLLGLGVWIFLVVRIPSPAVMACGALTLALTGLAWRRHRRVVQENLSNLSMDSVSEPR